MEPAGGFWQSRGRLTGVVAAVLLLSFLIQWPCPAVADWQQFSFYDPGTTLKGDLLIQKGYVPSEDFGYTHGLLSLVYGRAGFAVLGRTWWAFLVLTVLAEMGMAWGLARIFVATGLARRWASLLFVLLALPMAVMPAYLTLTHPLEAMLILLALAEQAEGNKSRALLLMAMCLFVKPSMAYVYGLVLLGLIVWGERGRVMRIARQIAPAVVVFGLVFLALGVWFGWMPVVKTLLPLTGAKAYASTTGFGFFSETTREQFWWPADRWKLLFGPAGVYLMAVLACVIGAALCAAKFARQQAAADAAPRNCELLLTIGILHTAFLLAFYGFHRSWTYYSYMPVLGLALFAITFFKRRRTVVFVALAVLMLLSHGALWASSWSCWHDKTPQAVGGPGAMPGLWRYADQYAAWTDVLKTVGDRPTLVLTNGYMTDLPANGEVPDAWFPEPGISTSREIARIQKQVDRAEFVVLFGHLAQEGVELWTSKDFVSRRGQFEEARTFTWPNQPDNVIFTLLRRVRPAQGHI